MQRSLLIGLCLMSSAAMADTPPTQGIQPSVSQDQVYRALSVRDPVPSCETVEAMSSTPVADLLFVVENATQPPWTAMRAAQCLVRRHAEVAQPEIESWVTHEATRGLALMTFGLLDTMPQTVSIPVAKQALQGPLAAEAQPRLLRSEVPEIRALAQP